MQEEEYSSVSRPAEKGTGGLCQTGGGKKAKMK